MHRLVWVNLEVVFRRTQFPPATFRWDERTLNPSGETHGVLHGWYRATSGDWYGLVSYAVPYAGPLGPELDLTDQLVPAAALRPRLYGRERRA